MIEHDPRDKAWAGNGFSVIVNLAVLPHNRYTVMSRPGEGAARSSRSMGRHNFFLQHLVERHFSSFPKFPSFHQTKISSLKPDHETKWDHLEGGECAIYCPMRSDMIR